MNYFKVIFYKNDVPDGKAYTFRSEEEFHHGDIVELPHHKKGMVSGILDEKDVDYDLEKIQSIVGVWKDEDDGEKSVG